MSEFLPPRSVERQCDVHSLRAAFQQMVQASGGPEARLRAKFGVDWEVWRSLAKYGTHSATFTRPRLHSPGLLESGFRPSGPKKAKIMVSGLSQKMTKKINVTQTLISEFYL